MSRIDGRNKDSLRDYRFDVDFIGSADGSVLVTCGNTRVIVTAKVEEKVPPFLDKEKEGWLTAEYAMLPASCNSRVKRDKAINSGRSQEISRLIGRSLRAMVDMKKFPGLTIHVDADVIEADGGTRTAAITGAYVAVYRALESLQKHKGLFSEGLPITNQVAAVSVGICDGEILLDLKYEEDSTAAADSNFVMTSDLNIVEIQGTAENGTFSQDEFNAMFETAKNGLATIFRLQNKALGK